MNSLLLIVYRAFILPFVIVAILPCLYLLSAKFRRLVQVRRQPRDWPKFKKQPIWIHAASGEFEYAKPLCRELKRKHPDTPILVTFLSPSFVKTISDTPEVDCVWPLPLDLPGPTSEFLKRMQPKIGLIARTDLWPELLNQCQQRRIPTVLFSARQIEVPFLNFLKRILLKWNYSQLTQILCVSEADALNIKHLSPRANVAVTGDTRYDQVHHRLQQKRPLNERLKPLGLPPVLVAGSTWSEDEDALIHATADLVQAMRLQLIIVPHEPSPAHLSQLKTLLTRFELGFTIYSEASNWETDVLIVDQVGILAELYTWGQLAFVGGSFKSGVHSVMEPLAVGLPTFVGPHFKNSREAVEFKEIKVGEMPLVHSAKDARHLKEGIAAVLERQAQLPAMQKKLLQEMTARTGSTERVINILRNTTD